MTYIPNIIISCILLGLIFCVKRIYHKTHFVVPRHLRSTRTILLQIGEVLIISNIIAIIITLPLINLSTIQTSSIQNSYIQILFDTSLSMAADDIKPSRFIAAKQSLQEFIKQIQTQQRFNWSTSNLNTTETKSAISLINFAGIPSIYIPFSTHIQSIQSKLAQTNRDDFPPIIDYAGTALGDAILLAIQNIKNNSSNVSDNNYLIILTDGDANKGYNPIQTIPILQEYNITAYTLAIGTTNQLIGIDQEFQAITTQFDPSIIEKIAQDTRGIFYSISNQDELQQALNEISQQIKQNTPIQREDSYQKRQITIQKILLYLLVIQIVTYIVLYYIAPTKSRKTPSLKHQI